MFPFLRRWDHQASNDTEGVVSIVEIDDGKAKWFTLEGGVQIHFVEAGEKWE
jgi:hypothetical protein